MLKNFKNLHKDKRVFILGSGPSIKKMDLSFLKYEHTICVNDSYLILEKLGFYPDYMVFLDKEYWHRNRQVFYNKPLTVFPCSNVFGPKGNENPYMSNNMGGIIKVKDPISEYQKKKGETDVCCDTFHFDLDRSPILKMAPTTVIMQAIPLAFYMGFKEIYLIGCDTSSKGYFYEKKKNYLPVNRVLQGYRTIQKYIEPTDRKVVDLTVNGNIDAFPKMDYRKFRIDYGKNILVTVCTEDWEAQAKALIGSCIKEGKWEGDFGIITDMKNERIINSFEKKGVNVFQEKIEPFDNPKCLALKCFSGILDNWDNVLFVDCDIIINRNINTIFQYSLNNKLNIASHQWPYKTEFKNWITPEEFKDRGKAYNSGVFLFNTKDFKFNYLNLIETYYKYHDVKKWNDQSVINIAMYNVINEIPEEFNAHSRHIINNDDFMRKSKIIHFPSQRKPWKNNIFGKMFYKEWIKGLKFFNQLKRRINHGY